MVVFYVLYVWSYIVLRCALYNALVKSNHPLLNKVIDWKSLKKTFPCQEINNIDTIFLVLNPLHPIFSRWFLGIFSSDTQSWWSNLHLHLHLHFTSGTQSWWSHLHLHLHLHFTSGTQSWWSRASEFAFLGSDATQNSLATTLPPGEPCE